MSAATMSTSERDGSTLPTGWPDVATLERLANEAVTSETGGRNAEGLVLERRPTQQELANMVGSCRETISRTFTSVIKRGLIVPRGRALILTRALLDKRPQTTTAQA